MLHFRLHIRTIRISPQSENLRAVAETPMQQLSAKLLLICHDSVCCFLSSTSVLFQQYSKFHSAESKKSIFLLVDDYRPTSWHYVFFCYYGTIWKTFRFFLFHDTTKILSALKTLHCIFLYIFASKNWKLLNVLTVCTILKQGHMLAASVYAYYKVPSVLYGAHTPLFLWTQKNNEKTNIQR